MGFCQWAGFNGLLDFPGEKGFFAYVVRNMTHISEFLPKPENLLALGDIWDRINPQARAAILQVAGNSWVGASGKWTDIPASARLEVAHRVYFFRDFLNAVLP